MTCRRTLYYRHTHDWVIKKKKALEKIIRVIIMEDNDDYFKNGGYAIINLYKLQWWNSLIMLRKR